MKRFSLAALVAAMLVASGAAFAADAQEQEPPPAPSALDAQLFYELLVGEMSASTGESVTGVALMLDAARKTNDPELYKRAVELAYEAHSGDAALQAARAWKQAFPKSREANRFVLQILVVLNRLPETVEPLRADIALTDAIERNAVLASVPRLYARVADHKAAAEVVQQALSDALQDKETAASAWAAIGRLRLAADDAPGAIDAVKRAQAVDPHAEAPALLALEMMDPKQPEAEQLFKEYLKGKPLPQLRMAYARVLVDSQRYGEAAQQVQAVTAQRPDYPEAWLVQGSLQLQDGKDAAAEASLKHYLELAQNQKAGDERRAGEAQAYLNLSRIAEKRKDYALAGAWLDKVQDPQDLIAAQQRRAAILARQGKLDEARKLIRALPERDTGDARIKMLAEVQLLRDSKQYKAAFDVLAKANAKEFDPDLAYDQAMIAEKMGNTGEMERLLREVIDRKPDYHHAYNALGYSFAERNVRLPEAKALIEKALTFAPADPFISDSLGWVEFRMGNKAQALHILEEAYKSRPDADIAAHLGEVLWSMGERERAQSIWKEGLLLNGENDTLQQTLTRLHVKL